MKRITSLLLSAPALGISCVLFLAGPVAADTSSRVKSPADAATVASETSTPGDLQYPGISPNVYTKAAAKPDDKGWKLFGSLRARLEDQNFFPTPKANGAYTYFADTIRFGVMRQTKPVDYLFELEAPGLWNLPTGAIASAPQGQLGHGATYFAENGSNVATVFIMQAYVRLKEFSDKSNSLKLGRFDFNDGQETVASDPALNWIKTNRIGRRLLGPFDYTVVTRSFDGFQFVNDSRKGNLTAMGAFPTRGAFDIHGADSLSDIRVAYISATAPHVGKNSASDARLFYLFYDDTRPGLVKTDNRTAAARGADRSAIRIATYGGHYARVMKAGVGKTDVMLWGAGQLGTWGVLDHGAYAFAAELGYQLPTAAWKPWFRAGYYYGSGDGNPTNGRHGTFFPVLPTARNYARYPFFAESNLQDVFGQLIIKPTAKLTLRSDVHGLRLADSHDLWYSGGGAFNNSTFGYSGRPSGGSGNLATLVDTSADYQLYKNTSITLYGAYANGGGVVANSFSSRDSVFGYLELNVKF